MCKFIMLVGVPGSGKSFYAKALINKEKAVVLSSDTIRKELFGDENDNKHNDEVFKTLHQRLNILLSKNINVIYDATNIGSKKRKHILQIVNQNKNKDIIKECHYLRTDIDKCLENNKNRDRHVPEYIIHRMYQTLCLPNFEEGWDVIKTIEK